MHRTIWVRTASPRTAWQRSGSVQSIWPRSLGIAGLGAVCLLAASLCGCSLKEIFDSGAPTLLNAVAIDRALRLCSLTRGEAPFHLTLEISPPERASALPQAEQAQAEGMQAQVDLYWINPITYRTEIHSQGFTQTRIVNGQAVEEHDTGDFYPRWIENFVDALLDPVPQAAQLSKVPGSVPVGVQEHACIDAPTPEDGAGGQTARICFQDAEPRLASGVDSERSVWFDNFAPFARQQIARTLVNDLPSGLLVRSRVTLLEPLPQADYPLLKATELTLPDKQIVTQIASRSAAESLLQPDTGQGALAQSAEPAGQAAKQGESKVEVYLRTDRTGKVREVYSAIPGQGEMEEGAVARALTLKFKPLVVDGVARQMEAEFAMH